MKIEYLREFAVLAEYLNFSIAAEHLYLSQPVLSRHISMLEKNLGVPLFQRNTQSVALTEAGHHFRREIEKILFQYDELRNDLLLKNQGYDTILRIGLPYYSMNDYLGFVPQIFVKEYPQIKLSYFASDPDQCISALFQDQVDVIIIAHLSFPNAERLQFYDLYQEPLAVMLNRQHPLANRQSIVLSDLKEDTFLSIGSHFFSSNWLQVRSLCLKNGFEPRGPVMYNQMESVLVAIQQNAGVTVSGRHLRILSSNTLACVDLNGEGCSRYVSIAYKTGNTNTAIPRFIKVFEQLKQAGWNAGASPPSKTRGER